MFLLFYFLSLLDLLYLYPQKNIFSIPTFSLTFGPIFSEERFLTLCWVRIFWRTLFFRKNSAIWTQRKNFFFRWNFYRHLRKLLIQKVKNFRSHIHFFKVPNPSKRRKERNNTPRPIRASVKITLKRLFWFVLVIF